jgi:hypothetical protein
VRVESEAAGPGDTIGVGVDAHRLARGVPDELVEPGAALSLRGHLTFVDEAEVDHAPPSDEAEHDLGAVDEPGRRYTVDRRRAELGRHAQRIGRSA